MGSDMKGLHAGGSNLVQAKRMGVMVEIVNQTAYCPLFLPRKRQVFTRDVGLSKFLGESLGQRGLPDAVRSFKHD
jgi:hypothetical protein